MMSRSLSHPRDRHAAVTRQRSIGSSFTTFAMFSRVGATPSRSRYFTANSFESTCVKPDGSATGLDWGFSGIENFVREDASSDAILAAVGARFIKKILVT